MTIEQSDAMTEAALTAADHSVGDAHASVTLLEYGDYSNPACILADPVTQHLIETFGERLRFVFRHFPLVEVHQHAGLAAQAAEAAAAQGKFWEMHQLLFSQQQQLNPATLVTYAQSIGLDMLRFNAEMADRIYRQRVQEHRRAGELCGVRSTPSFFLNGTPVDISLGLEKLDEAIRGAFDAAPTSSTRVA